MEASQIGQLVRGVRRAQGLRQDQLAAAAGVGGGGGQKQFSYAEGWLADGGSPALSCSLPKRPEPFRRRACRPFFEGLLPEGTQREVVAQVLGVSPSNQFRLLERLGGDVAGALTSNVTTDAPAAKAGYGDCIRRTSVRRSACFPSANMRLMEGQRSLTVLHWSGGFVADQRASIQCYGAPRRPR